MSDIPEMTEKEWIRKALRRAYDIGDGSVGYLAVVGTFEDDHYPDEIELMVDQVAEGLGIVTSGQETK